MFLVLALFIQAHNSNVKDSPSIFSNGSNASSSIYYDKIEEEFAAKNRKTWLCCRKKKVGEKESSSSSSSSDEAEKHEYAVKYKDLESLLSRFDSA